MHDYTSDCCSETLDFRDPPTYAGRHRRTCWRNQMLRSTLRRNRYHIASPDFLDHRLDGLGTSTTLADQPHGQVHVRPASRNRFLVYMYRCRLSWHFLLISIWKLVTSVSVACIAIHRCLILRREDRRPSPPSHESVFQHEDYSSGYLLQSPYPRPSNGPRQISQSSDNHPRNSKKTNLAPLHWLFLYLAGTVVGMTGLCSLLWTSFREDKAVQHLTYGFAAPMVIIPVLVAIYWYGEHCFGGTSGCCGLLTAYEHTFKSACVAFVVMFGFLSALYGDLILGVIADNVTGFPSSDIAPLYWVWFIAKRVPMLSI